MFFLQSAIYSFGQVSIKGRIKDQRQNLSFATVSLASPDSSIIKTVSADGYGEFIFENLSPGFYVVSSSLVGYSKFYSDTISVENKNIILPDIILKEATTELNVVTVKAKKPLFEQKIDRLVVNVQSSITSSGNTVLDVLQKSPGYRGKPAEQYNYDEWKIRGKDHDKWENNRTAFGCRSSNAGWHEFI